MLHPDSINQTVYKGVFQIGQLSAMTGEITYGEFVDGKNQETEKPVEGSRLLKGFNRKKKSDENE